MLTHIQENPFKLWKELTMHCLKEGTLRIDDDGNEIIELLAVSFQIKFPLNREEEIKGSWDEGMIGDTEKRFTTVQPSHGSKPSPAERIFGNSDESPYNIIKSILMEKPESKKAAISLTKNVDLQDKRVPCIVTIDFIIRDGLLNLYYFARSQDIFKRSYADNIALAQIQKRLADDLDLKVGTLSGYIVSAHIYKSDLESISSLALFKSISDDIKASR